MTGRALQRWRRLATDWGVGGLAEDIDRLGGEDPDTMPTAAFDAAVALRVLLAEVGFAEPDPLLSKHHRAARLRAWRSRP